MKRYIEALTVGCLIGVALGGAFFILRIELCDGRTEFAW